MRYGVEKKTVLIFFNIIINSMRFGFSINFFFVTLSLYLKVDKAYGLLVNESNPTKEKGYVAALYSNIKKCIADKHIHLQTKADFIDSLIKRAEPELNGR